MRRAFTFVEGVVVVAIIFILAAILFPVLTRPGHSGGARRSVCQSNLKQMGLGLIQYGQDYDGSLPSSRIGSSTGWSEVAQPYIKSWTVFQCPSTQKQTTPSTDYFFNARLSRGYLPKMKNQSRILMACEGDDDMPVWAGIRQLPPNWSADETSPSRRHLDMANYLFADGHVKAFKPDQISIASPKTAKVTFAIR